MRVDSSFRDPQCSVHKYNGIIYRFIHHSYRQEFTQLISSGLYEALVKDGLLVSHAEVQNPKTEIDAYKVIVPETIPFISYPYEWCFTQLKTAALLTLRIQKIALDHGMILKDSSAYNVQFRGCQPVFIDTCSFETYQTGRPWQAYRQFCQHFLAPLALMSYVDARVNRLSQLYIDGIPLSLTSKLLPMRSWFCSGAGLHLRLHAVADHWYSRKRKVTPKTEGALRKGLRKYHLYALIDNLKSSIEGMQYRKKRSFWSGYYEYSQYTQESFLSKQQSIGRVLDRIKPVAIFDIGANTGVMSRIASARGIMAVALDYDHDAVEKNFCVCQKNNDTYLLPLIADVCNPSPAIGWENKERDSLFERVKADMIFVLAFLHHLVIGNSIPMEKIAHFLSKNSRWLVIEFVPITDPCAQKLLRGREGLFKGYCEDAFQSEFKRYFTIEERIPIRDSQRMLYVMKNIDRTGDG